MVIALQSRHTLTIPAELRRALGLEAGAHLDATIENGRLVLTPVEIIPKVLRLSAAGEAKEEEADEDIAAGRVASFDSAEDLIRDLDSGS